MPARLFQEAEWGSEDPWQEGQSSLDNGIIRLDKQGDFHLQTHRSNPMLQRLIQRRVKPSTLAFWQEARQRTDFSLFDFLHGYVYLRWPYLYIGIGTGEHPLAKVLVPVLRTVNQIIYGKTTGANSETQPSESPKGMGTVDWEERSFADTYHGKVVPLASARELVSIREPIQIDDLERVIPYKLARDIVLDNPDHIAVLDCPCRSARENPCLPLDVCLLIGEPFASMVTDQHPSRSRWVSSEEAIAILEAEEERGHVHHAFFKDAMLGRFYAICNCCACCCGAMQAHHSGTPMLASSGFLAQVDELMCQGCGVCETFCQFEAISIPDGYAVIDFQACMGCGICVAHCQYEAVALVPEPSKGLPLEICALMEATMAPQVGGELT
jgi:ferredoxin